MRISIVEENRRPHDLVQVAKFGSEAAVKIHHELPLSHRNTTADTCEVWPQAILVGLAPSLSVTAPQTILPHTTQFAT